MPDKERDGGSHVVSFEEIMFTLISATQDVFRDYMNVELLAGHVDKQMPTVNMDFIAIIGIGGHRVGYIMIGAEKSSAATITKRMLAEEAVDAQAARDAFGELANNIAGVFRTKYHEQYGIVPMGLPLVASGAIHPVGPRAAGGAAASTLKVQHQGIVIPFQTADGTIRLKVMYYM
jgi:CheY-specific phosphatase CheX